MCILLQSQLGGVITSGGGFSTVYPRPEWQDTAVDDYFSGLGQLYWSRYMLCCILDSILINSV